MTRKTRPVSWIKPALKEFEVFPEGARSVCLAALTIAAEGGKADIAKPLHGLGSGVFEIALPFKGDAFRVVYSAERGAAMKNEKLEVVRGSGNIFRDLGVDNADAQQFKAI